MRYDCHRMKLQPRRLALALPIGLAALVAAVWAPSLSGAFVWDDKNDIVRSDRIHDLGAVVEAFRHHAMWSATAPETTVATYRPIAIASLAIDYRLWGLWPVGYHVTSILLHVLATLAVMLALSRILGDKLAAAALALLFSLQPADAEAVAWINGRSEIFALGFGALALWAAASRRWLILAPALLGAMLGKETGAVFVPLSVAVAWIDAKGERLQPSWPAPVAAVLGLAAYGVLRFHALGPSTLPGSSLGAALRSLPAVWMRATQEALLPLDRAPVTVSTWLESLPTWESALYLGASLFLIAIGIVLVVKRRLVAVLGLAWWLGALVPLTAIAILDYPWPGLARWLYVGLPGLLLFVWKAAIERLGRRARLVTGALLGLAWLVASERAIPVWHDDTALYSAMIDAAPEDAWAWRALGSDQLAQGHFAEAAKLFEGATERDHTGEVNAAFGLEAFTWTFLGRCDEAVALYRDHPPTPAVEPNRFVDAAAACFARAGDRDRARQLWSLCARVRRSCVEALERLDREP